VTENEKVYYNFDNRVPITRSKVNNALW
jgi:hypothetical protein